MPPEASPSSRAIRIGATLFTLAVFLVSWWRWWTFQYGTFDLAFYVQALWLAVRGQWHVSLLNVPLMGNHAEPLVFLLTPLFAICPHPMLFVVVQTLALASMAFTGFRIATRLGLERRAAIALGLATLLIPASSSVGVYEFHPEALVAPLLLLLIEAKLAERYGRFWLWFVAVLACKENMALLLVAFCGVFAILEWKRGRAWLLRWNLGPLLLAAGWLFICARVISPTLNAGNVDYGQLYSHLGGSGPEIVRNFFFHPSLAAGAVWKALTEGNMVWSLLFPLLLLPLMRPRWLLISVPILFQHLLSWRYTEWSLGAHYPAPFIPLFWIAAVEGVTRFRQSTRISFAVAVACLAAHAIYGPVREVIAEIPGIDARLEAREWKAQLLATIPPEASVTTVQPFLSHLAKRREIYSLHHVLKGLKTLSKERYIPPMTDVVVIDYADTSTFSPAAGFYHPRSHTDAERFVPSSDRLLHDFLAQRRWHVLRRNEVAIYTPGEPLPAYPPTTPPVPFDDQTTLINLSIPHEWPGALQLRFAWEFGPDRLRFPWMMLVLSNGKELFPITMGACAPEGGPGRYYEEWIAVLPDGMPAGNYGMFALFFDATEAAWNKKLPPNDLTFALKQIELGNRQLTPGAAPDRKP